ncbi:FtsX-like permease family protein [Limosilactobacillus vaginalis]|jgi:putative ABC transport system permease protein|uniref:FtsX-like permease family protein n=1 Tax=Limosilactobacillus vaginalis TaxID=1633 RepID=A0ABT4K553_9LACO|nr:FtsX-like permease family protein [Limosilactobacillus vaginalis]MCZ3746116.1 FtsX-like permease family protein [Limosilactobacillus vaginalis]MCZ3751098.1 FtsX-like permease family protein [Limosilactobacillus vaginalis]MCZ3752823.1 FtsX-like permease family protein [Limosilactobacillus vaginalis]MCZ3754547.1 FtsX-like permease family protein [Limosilactobacillus vaginalis]MCZ3756270.1 FtsX-like permease family protein [Limosilactobacillus vaginalis]
MLYFKLINSSFKRNMRSYGPYLMATIMLVAINYIFLAIEANSSLKKLNTGAVTSAMLDLGFKFIFLVTLAFLIYVNRFLWQQRSREIGLYSMLGMTSHNLQLLTIIEKCYLMVISLVAGLAFGIIFEKLAFLGFGYLLNIGHISQPWFVSSAITKTIILTGCLFAIIMVIDLVKLHRLTPNQLWHPEAVTPKRHGILYSIAGILGFALLIWAYYITLTIKPKISAISHFLLAVILLVIGTYLVFIIGSIILLKLLQKNSHFYYKPRHFIAVSGMIQRMQQNGASLATICLLCSSILVILFTSITLYVGIGSTVKSYAPEDVVITSNQGLTKEQKRVINTSARQHHAKINHYLTYKMTTPQYGYWRDNKFISQGSIQKMDSKASSSVILLTTNEYNRITNQHVHLTGNEALTYTNNKGHDGTLIVNNQKYHARKLQHFSGYFNPDHSIYTPTFIIANKLPKSLPLTTVTTFNYQLSGNQKQRIKFENALQAKLGINNLSFTGKATITSLINSLYGGLVFVGILISLALAITTTIVIYFKQISEGYADRKRFKTMQQVGLSEKETVKSIHSQVLMVFLLPVVGAIVNLCFAIPAIRQIMIQLNFYNLPLMITVGIIVAISLLILYLILYGLTTRTYRQIVDGQVEEN